MRKTTVIALSSLLLAIPGLLSASQDGGEEDIVFRGIHHSGLGDATLSIVEDAMRVSNIGSSGQDGVRAELGFPMPAEWAFFVDEINDSPGATLAIEPFGNMGGKGSERLATLRFTDMPDGLAIEPDFSPIGSTTYRLELYRNGVLIDSFPGMSGTAGHVVALDGVLPANWFAGGGFVCPFDDHDLFWADWLEDHGFIFQDGGDTIIFDSLIAAAEASTSVSSLDRVDITAGGIPVIDVVDTFAGPEAQPPADLELVSLGVSVSTPVAARHAGDGSNRLFVVQRSGTIMIYEPGTGMLPSPFLDITAAVDTTFEGGLLGLAFHPDFATNGYFYVNYTRDGSGGDSLTTTIERYTVSAGDPNDADETSALEILAIGQPAANHNGGDLHFGPDGYLYIGMGDGGASSATSQDMSNLLGKMLRIDPCDTAGCPNPYTIPADNPFVGATGLDEIWGVGFRNPYRWSFDRDTGDLLIADVGAGSREEVSFEAAGGSGGLNYGWNCREGDIPGPGGCSGSFVDPVLTYDHSGGNCSITGGFRYRGCIEGLRGTYIYADFCTAKVYFGTEDIPGVWSFTEWDDLSGNVYGFGEDESGELYLLQGGSIHRFESASDCEAGLIFRDGFESGDTSAW